MQISIANAILVARLVGKSIVRRGLKMWLDFKKSNIRGCELVVNGDFSDGLTGWSSPVYNSTISIVDGKLRIVSDGLTVGRASTEITTVIGRVYNIVGSVTNVNTQLGIRLKISNTSDLDGAYYGSPYNSTTNAVVISHIFTATASTTFVGIDQGNNVGGVGFLNNISVKEVGQFIPDESNNCNEAELYTGKALSFNGNDEVSDFGNPNINLKSICFWVNLSTTSEQIFNLTSTHNITASSGVITLGGTWSNSNIYVNAVATATIGTTLTRVVITTDTNILVNDLEFAKIGSDYGALILSDVQIYDAQLTLADAVIDYNNPNDLVFNKGGSIALSNLKGYYALSEGSGSITYDSSGQGNNGAITGATYVLKQPTIPQLGMMDWKKYMIFDGVNDYVQLATTTLTGDCTIGFTYNTTSPNGSFLGKASTTVIRYEWFNNDRVIAIIGGNSYVFIITTDLVKDSSSMVFTRVGTLLSLYLEGVFVQSKTVSTSDWVFADARIGYSNWNKFNGLISQAYMFSDALSASEVLAIHNTNTIPSTDLYGHWINSGTDTWLDLSTNSNNGTPTGSPETMTLIQNPNELGKDILGNTLRLREGGLNLDGTGYAEVADDASLDVTTAVTLECWVKWNTENSKGLIAKWGPNGDRSFLMQKVTNGVDFYLFSSSFLVASSDTVTGTGDWKHIACTYNGSTQTVYINGSVSGTPASNSGNIQVTTRDVEIGRYDSNNYYSDIIDEIRIYNISLTATEVLNNYKVGLKDHQEGSAFSTEFSSEYGF